MQFTPTEDFFSTETRSQYLKGFSYSVRPGNKKLEALVDVWLREGKVTLGGPAGQSGQISGKGEVT